MSEAIAASDFDARYDYSPSTAQRAALTAGCAALAACGGWALMGDPFRQILWICSIALALTWCVCDMRARILPVEISCAFLACAIAWQGVQGTEPFLLAAACGAVVGAVFLALSKIYSLVGADHAVGGGDVRLAVPVAVASGTSGLAFGIAAAIVVLAAHLMHVKIKSGTVERSTGVPMGPMLAAWALAGMIGPVLAEVIA